MLIINKQREARDNWFYKKCEASCRLPPPFFVAPVNSGED